MGQEGNHKSLYICCMRMLGFLAAMSLPVALYAQVFYFNTTSTTLIKDVSQSPAHWYIEIHSNLSIDTNLRWKANFSNIPLDWVINFDTQSTFHSPVNDGDSANFTLLSGLAFPQKLIIGAEFNGVVGNGSVFFDVYDPNVPMEVVTIEYRFIATNSAGLDEEGETSRIFIRDGKFVVPESMKGYPVVVYSIEGRELWRQDGFEEIRLPDWLKGCFLVSCGAIRERIWVD